MYNSEQVKAKAEELLWEAETKAWNSLAHGKFSLFGYWAAKVVQVREILGRSSDPGPFRELVKMAMSNAKRETSEKQ